MLSIETVRERLHQAPFKAFEIRLSDGQRVVVNHPDYVAIGGSVVFVIAFDDHVQQFNVQHIVSIDDVRAKRRNGRARR